MSDLAVDVPPWIGSPVPKTRMHLTAGDWSRSRYAHRRFLVFDQFVAHQRVAVGGAHWSRVGVRRLGAVATLEQTVQSSNSQLLARRLLAQTDVEF